MSFRRRPTVGRFGGWALLVIALAVGGCGAEPDQETGEQAESGERDVFDLQVGDCLADFEDAKELASIEAPPCSEPHTDEIFASDSIRNGEFPGMEAVEAAAKDICLEKFDEFVGIPYEESVLDVGYLTPTEESWNDGDRAVLCTVFDPAEEVTGSLRDAER